MVMSGRKILVTGAAGRIAFPLSLALAADNEVWGVARFSDEGRRRELEDAGVTTRTVDLAK
ncbi:MAG: NAD(P)-dependent oxidoreductase, partial [Jiangellaceae bacterium]